MFFSFSLRHNFTTILQRDTGSQERQDKLKEIGFVDILHKLSQATDPNLSERCAQKFIDMCDLMMIV